MYKTPSEAVSLIEELKPLVKDAQAEVVVCPPFICLPAAKEALEGSNIRLGAQNMYWEEQGAFTGEVAPGMLTEAGVEYVIIGHSERRQYFSETDDMVNRKMLSAVSHNLIPIICVGETLEQREQGVTEKVVDTQTRAALNGLTADVADRIVIAYEPVWAIGTGRTASSDDANEVIGYIRKVVESVLGSQAASRIRILYGGSVKPENAAELMQMPEIDGGLVGGASLKALDFSKIVNY
jgi:triosephosphate isomerase